MTQRPSHDLLTDWLSPSQPGDVRPEPPDGLDADVVEAVLALRPDLAPPARVDIDDILDSLREGPLAGGSDAVALADWLDDPDAADAPIDDDVREAAYALRPELAPPARVSLDDILGAVTTGPFADSAPAAYDTPAEVIPFPTPAPLPAPVAIDKTSPPARRLPRWWAPAIGGLAVAATALLFIAPIANEAPPRVDEQHSASPVMATTSGATSDSSGKPDRAAAASAAPASQPPAGAEALEKKTEKRKDAGYTTATTRRSATGGLLDDGLIADETFADGDALGESGYAGGASGMGGLGSRGTVGRAGGGRSANMPMGGGSLANEGGSLRKEADLAPEPEPAVELADAFDYDGNGPAGQSVGDQESARERTTDRPRPRRSSGSAATPPADRRSRDDAGAGDADSSLRAFGYVELAEAERSAGEEQRNDNRRPAREPRAVAQPDAKGAGDYAPGTGADVAADLSSAPAHADEDEDNDDVSSVYGSASEEPDMEESVDAAEEVTVTRSAPSKSKKSAAGPQRPREPRPRLTVPRPKSPARQPTEAPSPAAEPVDVAPPPPHGAAVPAATPKADAPVSSAVSLDELRRQAVHVPSLAERHPELADTWATAEAQRGNPAAYAQTLTPLLRHPDPDVGADAALRIGRRYLQAGRTGMALTAVAQGLGRGGASPAHRAALLHLRGQALERRGDPDGARRAYKQADEVQ